VVADPVTDIVRRLTRDGVRRLEQFEVLLLMARRAAEGWTAPALARSSMLAPNAVTLALEQLHRLGFVERLPGEPPSYRLGTRIPVEELLQIRRVYERDRLRVVNEFFGSNLDVLRNFADAFKLRGDS
jgi:hypothetical protein